ncbi:hypothetical protein H4R35_001012 [Dimargaris xerosporica]|nr:hypothetical protein H4R35_001012 [Dimargaris xerosporica]
MQSMKSVLQSNRVLSRLRTLRSTNRFETHYKLTPHVLGSGTYGVVRRAICKSTKTEYAVKIIDKKLFKAQKPKAQRYLASEIEILRRIHHPNIVALHDIYETSDTIYLVMDLALGGELFDQLYVMKSYTESDARRIVRQILQGVAYLHSQGIVHRDLKPENLLLRDMEPSSDILLADFGLSTVLPSHDAVLLTACGTPGYVAPEVLCRTGYGKKVDMWSIGVITYFLLCGYTPFWGEDEPALFEAIKACQYDFDEIYWKHISPRAMDFISKLLQVDPNQRMTAVEALEHPWFEDPEQATLVDLKDMVKANSESRRTIRRAVTVVSAASAFKEAGDKRASRNKGFYNRMATLLVPKSAKAHQPTVCPNESPRECPVN